MTVAAHRLTVALALGFALTLWVGGTVQAQPILPFSGSGSGSSSDAPIVGESFVSRNLAWTFPATDKPYTAYVQVSPIDETNIPLLKDNCVNDRTGTFAFDLQVGGRGATRTDLLWMKASQSIFDQCAIKPSKQEWSVQYEDSRGASASILIQYVYRDGVLNVYGSFGRYQALVGSISDSTIDLRPATEGTR